MTSPNVPDNVTVPDFILERMSTQGNAVALVSQWWSVSYAHFQLFNNNLVSFAAILLQNGFKLGHCQPEKCML
jgi:hypothetical protein